MANSGKLTFKTGVTIERKDGEKRFEAGQKVPDDLTKEELKALKDLDAIGE